MLATEANWTFVRVAATAAIQSHTSGARPAMQYSSKPKAFTIIRVQSQRIAPNIVEQLDRAVERVAWPCCWLVMLHSETRYKFTHPKIRLSRNYSLHGTQFRNYFYFPQIPVDVAASNEKTKIDVKHGETSSTATDRKLEYWWVPTVAQHKTNSKIISSFRVHCSINRSQSSPDSN